MIKMIISIRNIIFHCMCCIFMLISCESTIYIENDSTPINETDCISLLYSSEIPIAGFQFDHASCVDSAYGGLAAANGFTISYSENTVLGFSLSGALIPSGSGILLNIFSENETFTPDCITDIILSDEDGNNIYNNQIITFEDCAALSVMSWNIENFPKSGHNTIDYVSSLINEIKPDIVGLQEMPSDSTNSVVLGFSLTGSVIPAGSGTLVNLGSEDCTEGTLTDFIFSGPGGNPLVVEWGGDYGYASSDQMECSDAADVCLSLVYDDLYYDSSVDIAEFQFNNDGCASGAASGDAAANGFIISAITDPLILLNSKLDSYDYTIEDNEVMSTVFFYKENNHLEFISETEIYDNDYDFPRSPVVLSMLWNGDSIYIINNHFKCCDDDGDFERRQQASIKLHDYIKNNLSNKKVIIIGDLNDSLTDTESENAFNIFLEDQTNYIIADMGIAQGHSDYWSYPGYPSHIDHIFLSTELSPSFNNAGSSIETILVDLNFDSWDEYDTMVSDHRPILIRLSY